MRTRLTRIFSMVLALASPVTARDAAAADCSHSDPALFARQFFTAHRSFYFQETPSLRSRVTPDFYRALRNHYRCQAAQGQCHIDYDPWLGAQDGDIRGHPRFSTHIVGSTQTRVTMSYRFELEPGKPVRHQQVELSLQRSAAPQCWQVDDLITPLGDSLARRYRSKTP